MNTASMPCVIRHLRTGLRLVLLALIVSLGPAAQAHPIAVEGLQPIPGTFLSARTHEHTAQIDASGRKSSGPSLLLEIPVRTAFALTESSAVSSGASFSLWQGMRQMSMPVMIFFSFLLSVLSVLSIRLLYNIIKSERLIKKLLRQSKKTDIIRVNMARNRASSITHFALINENGKKSMSLDALSFQLKKDIPGLYKSRYESKLLSRHTGFEEQIALSRGDESTYYTLYCLMLSRRRCLISLTDVTEETIRQQQLEKLAGIDPLTGLYDQQYFKKAITGQITAHARATALLLIINLRNFSEIIDRYSYTVGDDVLLGVSEQLKLFPHPAKILGRLEGDTFALLLCDLPSDFSADLIHNWSFSYEISQTKLELPVYGGLSVYPADADNADDLFAYALFTTELAKQNHNARILHFDPNAYVNHLRFQEALEAYPDVIQRELFYPVYQPVISLHTGGRFGYEAFTRCSHSAFPDVEQLIVVSRHAQDIDRLTLLLLKKSYDAFPFHRYPQQKLFIKMGFGFVTDADAFWNKYAAVLDNINFNHLVIEVTERYEIVNYKEHDALLARIKARGGTISLDDYGEGYSNEASLIRLRPAIVKLASTLVSCVDRDAYKRSFIHKFVQFAWKTDTLVLAEGVETQEEYEALKQLKVDMVQGYLLGKPEKVC